MWILIVSLLLLTLVALIAGHIRNRRLQKKIENGELESFPEVKEADIECCGQHEVCEKDSLLAAVSIMMMRNWINSLAGHRKHTRRKKRKCFVMCSIRCRKQM